MKQLTTALGKWISGIALAVILLVPNTSARAAPIDDAHKTEVMVPAGDIVLAGTLYRPAGATSEGPAVVLGHGSGKVTRQYNGYWINAALRTGVTVLAFDKRGTGKSTGQFPEWDVKATSPMFQDLAMDMVHATRWLSKQPGIDTNRIGLMGGSQAGWIMPLAASQEPLVRFVIVGEGVPLPVGVEQAHSMYLDYVSEEGEGNPSPRHLAAADILSMETVGSEDEPLGYDPRPVLEKMTTPVLWIFGLYDGVIPTRASIDEIGRLNKAGKLNHSIHIFPFGNHNFQNVFTGKPYDLPQVSRQWLQSIGMYP